MKKCIATQFKSSLVPRRALMLGLILLALFSAMSPGARQAAAEDYGTVYVHLHACGSFSGLPPTGLDQLESACVLTPYYNSFWITTEGNDIKGLPSNNNLDFAWQGIPNHIFQIQGQVDGHHSTPVVYCQSGDAKGYQLMQAT
jgi:hypothetical protein